MALSIVVIPFILFIYYLTNLSIFCCSKNNNYALNFMPDLFHQNNNVLDSICRHIKSFHLNIFSYHKCSIGHFYFSVIFLRYHIGYPFTDSAGLHNYYYSNYSIFYKDCTYVNNIIFHFAQMLLGYGFDCNLMLLIIIYVLKNFLLSPFVSLVHFLTNLFIIYCPKSNNLVLTIMPNLYHQNNSQLKSTHKYTKIFHLNISSYHKCFIMYSNINVLFLWYYIGCSFIGYASLHKLNYCHYIVCHQVCPYLNEIIFYFAHMSFGHSFKYNLILLFIIYLTKNFRSYSSHIEFKPLSSTCIEYICFYFQNRRRGGF